MNRRTVLKSLAAVPAAATLHGQTPPQEPGRAIEESPRIDTAVADSTADPMARFFTPDQFAALTHLCEIFEPSTPDTPGARESRSAEFLDFLVSQSPHPRQSLYRAGLDRLNTEAMRHYSRPFSSLEPPQSTVILEPLHRPWTYETPSDSFEQFLREAKADILQATRNSYQFISAVSKRSRAASGVGEFWYPMY